MSYTVTNSQGSTVAVVPDRHIDNESTSLNLIGYNTTQYGLAHAENFVHLLENFANETAPANPIEGQLWFDTGAQVMKVYNNSTWTEISGTPSAGGGGAFDNGLSAVYHLSIAALNTSILLIFAGGKIVAIAACEVIPAADLPASVIINAEEYLLQSVFPLGCGAGVTMAVDANDFTFFGHVLLADQSHFAGGGDANAPAGWTYIDLGTKTVGLMIAGGQIVAAVAKEYVYATELPAQVTITQGDQLYVPTPLPLASVFPAANVSIRDANGNVTSTLNGVSLYPGFTFATGQGIGQYDATLAALQATFTSNIGTAIAQATSSIEVWVDANSATAQSLTSLMATFTSLTGTTSVASAIQKIIATASDTSASTTAVTALRSEITDNSGTTSVAEAMQKLDTAATLAQSTSDALTSLESTFTSVTGQTNTADAISKLWTVANSAGATAGWSLNLDSNGYAIGIDALNGGAGNNYIKISTQNFIVGESGSDIIPFQVINGKVVMHSVEIDTLQLNSAIVPVTDNRSNQFYGTFTSKTATPTAVTVLCQATINMKEPGWIESSFNCKQGFTGSISGGTPWVVETFINGAGISITGGTVPGDSVDNQAVYYAATAGNYTVSVMWNAHTSIVMNQRSLFVKGYPFTQ